MAKQQTARIDDRAALSLLDKLDGRSIHAFVGAKLEDISIWIDKVVSVIRAQYAGEAYAMANIPDNPTLFDDFSVVDNIFLDNPAYYGLKRRNYVKLCQNMFDQQGVDISIHYRYGRLTTEQKKIVDVMWALINNYRFILLDDTYAHIQKYAAPFERILGTARANQQRVLYFTNKWEDATRVADQIHVIVNGVEKSTMSSADIKRNPHELICLLFDLKDFTADNELLENTLFYANNSLFRGAEHLTSSFEMNDTLSALTRTIVQAMGADDCILYLSSKSSDEYAHFTYNSHRNVPLLTHQAIDQFILNERVDKLHASVLDKDFWRLFKAPGGLPTCCVHAVPVVLKSVRIGMLQVCYNSQVALSAQALLLLRMFCNEIALSVETASLMNRSLLLNESHHRIKNNLQMIISLLAIQKSFMEGRGGARLEDVIDSIIQRIRSIAAIHDILTYNGLNSNTIPLSGIIAKLFSFYSSQTEITIKQSIEDEYISYKKATSIALVLNELISNSYKYAFFPEQSSKLITITTVHQGDMYNIIFKDNGIGLSDDFSVENNANFGLSIVNLIVTKEFKGTIRFCSDQGTRVEIVIPHKRIKEASIL